MGQVACERRSGRAAYASVGGEWQHMLALRLLGALQWRRQQRSCCSPTSRDAQLPGKCDHGAHMRSVTYVTFGRAHGSKLVLLSYLRSAAFPRCGVHSHRCCCYPLNYHR